MNEPVTTDWLVECPQPGCELPAEIFRHIVIPETQTSSGEETILVSVRCLTRDHLYHGRLDERVRSAEVTP